MEKETLLFLLQKLNSGTLTQDERIELASFFNKKQNKESASAALEELISQHGKSQAFDEKRYNPLIAGILKADTVVDTDEEETETEEIGISNPKAGGKKGWWMLLAAIVILVATGAYFYYFRPDLAGINTSTSKTLVNDVPPGGDKAVLTISDGSTIALDSIPNGFVAQEGNAKITKSANGNLQYQTSSEMNDANLFNTVTTPRGGQYLVILADGSRIKLNSSSSITYPVAFTGPERSVTVTGEAYFEVTANSKIPFKVRVYDMEVEVQGTQFNINAYLDEPAMKTTLLNGTLKLSKNSKTHMLQPSQQGIFDNQGNFLLEKNVDANQLSAWRNGKFQFNNSNLQTIMRQLGRWYDVDIVYERGFPQDLPVFGEIRRDVPLSEVVKLLDKSEVHCKIQGKKLIVLP